MMNQKMYHDLQKLSPGVSLTPPPDFYRLANRGYRVTGATVQDPQLSLFSYVVLQANADGTKNILVALTNNDPQSLEYSGQSTFEPGKLLAVDREADEGGGFLNLNPQEAKAMLGYYMDRLELSMWFKEPFLALQARFPLPVNASGSTGSSSSTNVGVFGDQVTAGIADSATVSRAIGDFTMVEPTTQNGLTHVWSMSRCKDGTNYRSPKDMWPDAPQLAVTHVAPLHGAPELAVGGFPIFEWTNWITTPNGQVHNEPVTCKIRVKAHMVLVANDQETATVASAPLGEVLDQKDITFEHAITINLADVHF